MFAAALTLTGLGVRWIGLDFISIDMRDFLLDWYEELATGGFAALSEPFSNYTPPYLYLLYLMTKTDGIIPRVAGIKLISICFDVLNAFLIYKFLKMKYPQGATALIGAVAFLLLPTVLLNSAYWGQADAVYVFFLLACIFFLMKDQPLIAMIFLGMAFSFKAQASFLGPLILLLVIRKRIPWIQLGIIPLVYVLMMIPAALAGFPLMGLLTVYLGQADTYHALSMHAPNLYLFIPDAVYTPAIFIGISITVIVTLAWTMIYARKIKEFAPENILLCALVSAALIPFLLPKMHDRYFYLADVLSFPAAFYFPRGWRLAIGYQLVSGLVYLIFLVSSMSRMDPLLAGSGYILATFVNTALLAYVFWFQWSLTDSDSEKSLYQQEMARP